ncbi:MAG: hypothetical protein Q9163_000514 [Psora crenata]
MSYDEPEQDLLELLRESLGMNGNKTPQRPSIQVLEDAEYVYDNAIDVALDMQGTKAAACGIYKLMQEKGYSTRDWSAQELHPKAKDESTVDFIFLMDLLNFSFWPTTGNPETVYSVDYRGKTWTGYWTLVAAIQRALDEGVPITNPSFWMDDSGCTDDVLRHVFRSSTAEEMPLLADRIRCMREAGYILQERFRGSFLTVLQHAEGSAAALVDLLVSNFRCFDDAHNFEGRRVRFFKRAQILVADLWACFEGESFGFFQDIDQITMFAGTWDLPDRAPTAPRSRPSDYRIPQMLHSLGCLSYSPPLESSIRQFKTIESGHSWEIQLRGCSIWCVELLKREMLRNNPKTHINAILIDFFLYDTMKGLEEKGREIFIRASEDESLMLIMWYVSPYLHGLVHISSEFQRN